MKWRWAQEVLKQFHPSSALEYQDCSPKSTSFWFYCCLKKKKRQLMRHLEKNSKNKWQNAWGNLYKIFQLNNTWAFLFLAENTHLFLNRVHMKYLIMIEKCCVSKPEHVTQCHSYAHWPIRVVSVALTLNYRQHNQVRACWGIVYVFLKSTLCQSHFCTQMVIIWGYECNFVSLLRSFTVFLLNDFKRNR